jgi:hypothetical protein
MTQADVKKMHENYGYSPAGLLARLEAVTKNEKSFSDIARRPELDKTGTSGITAESVKDWT